MLTKILTATIAITFPMFALTGLAAQEVVHATAGTVVKVDLATSALTIQKPDHSTEMFQLTQSLSKPISFDKSLREESEAANKLSKDQTQIIVYYFGESPETVVSVKDLGKDAVDISGTIQHVDKGQHAITIQADNGNSTTCYMAKNASVETSLGVVEGGRYSPKKGEKIIMVCTQEAGRETAQFIQIL